MTSAPSPLVGDQLPEFVLDVTTTRIVAGALATRDFMPVHHDREFARVQGAPDIFMNILSTNAYCGRYLSDWAGPESLLKSLDIRLGVPAFPGSTLRFSGRVTEIEAGQEERLVHVELRVTNDLGDHATGSAVVSVPA